MAQVWGSGVYFTFAGCYGGRSGRQDGLLMERLPFWAKFGAFGDRFFKNWISTPAGAKRHLNILCAVIILIISWGGFFCFVFFGICLCSILIPPVHVSNLLPNGSFPVFGLFWRPFLLWWRLWKSNRCRAFALWLLFWWTSRRRLVRSGFYFLASWGAKMAS